MNVFFANQFTSSTSALSYRTNTNVEFTFNPTISINISGDLNIYQLTPGNASDSNIITVTTESNAISGYTLSSTVGNTTNSSTELRKDNTSTTIKFDSITTNKASLSAFDDNSNTWGYSYCITSNDCTNSTYWQSGDITVTDPTSPLYPTTGYNGLPLYTSTPITLINSPSNNSSSIQFKIGARATSTQIAGEYNNVINFIGLANQNPTYITLDEATYMQDDFSCLATEYGTVKSLIDRRDGQSYLVAKANDGNCWMIENLKLGKTITAENPTLTLTPADSNVDDDFTLRYSDIPTDGKFHSYTINDIPNQNDGNEWICRSGENDWDSCYYNWYTATASTGTSHTIGGTSVDASICPTGWTLPTQSQFSHLYNKYSSAVLMEVNNPTTTKNNAAGKIPGFLLSGSYFTSGMNGFSSYGFYWSRTAVYTENAYDLAMDAFGVYRTDSYGKYRGFAARCLHN